jgi:hypothetical protein
MGGAAAGEVRRGVLSGTSARGELVAVRRRSVRRPPRVRRTATTGTVGEMNAGQQHRPCGGLVGLAVTTCAGGQAWAGTLRSAVSLTEQGGPETRLVVHEWARSLSEGSERAVLGCITGLTSPLRSSQSLWWLAV